MPALLEATLRSERIRLRCMVGLGGLVALLGLFRTLVPVAGAEALGPVVLVFSLAFVGFELAVHATVGRALADKRDVRRGLWVAHAVVESLYPVALMFAACTMDIDRELVLVSPAYAVLFLVVGASVLHLDPKLTLLTGAVATAGYAATVAFVLLTTGPGPLPVAMPISLTIALAAAAAFTVFIAGRMQSYVTTAVEKERLDRDLALARDIQLNLLPHELPRVEGYDFAASCQSADQTGGDYWDWQEVAANRVAISLADVTGHGVGPALVTAACRAYVRATISGASAADELIQRVNHLLSRDLKAGRFVTFALVDLDRNTHEGVLLCAGHGPSFLVKGATGEITSVDAHGVPLGIIDPTTLREAARFPLAPGDLIVLFSDGFHEWARADGEMFGIARLQQVVREHCGGSAQEVVDAMDRAVRGFVGDLPQADDMTAVVVKRVT